MITLFIVVNAFILLRFIMLKAELRAWGRWIIANLAIVAIASWWGWITLHQGAHPANVSWMPRPDLSMA